MNNTVSNKIKIIRPGREFSGTSTCPHCGGSARRIDCEYDYKYRTFKDTTIVHDVYVCEDETCECKFSVARDPEIKYHKADSGIGVMLGIITILSCIAAFVFLIIFIMNICGSDEAPLSLSKCLLAMIVSVIIAALTGSAVDWDKVA